MQIPRVFGAALPAAALIAALTAPVHAANITACTNVKQIVNVAMAYPTDAGVFTVAGWWTIPPGSCTALPSTPVNATHYFYAYTQSGDFTWPQAKGSKFCVSGNRFRYNDMTPSGPCPSGGEQRFFAPMDPVGGDVRIDFNQ